MTLSTKSPPLRVLLIGPLPPPHGGSRVSFARFLEYVASKPSLRIDHIDFPIRKRLPDGRYGGVATAATFFRGMAALAHIPSADRVVLFSSHGLAFTYGLILILAARIFTRPVALRLFGGRPYLPVASRRGISKWFTEWALSRASSISLETEVGRRDFPDSIRARVRAIRGYRSRVHTPPLSGQRKEAFTFVYAGRLDRSKGIDVLIDACRNLSSRAPAPNFEVHCYGSPSDEIERMSQIEPAVRLMGVVENDVYRGRLPGYDAFVYPSVYDNEGHPGALIEAMMAGLPIVCTALPTVTEIVSDGVEGLTVKPGSVGELADAMASIISDDRRRAGLADGSRRKGVTFDEDVVIPILLEEMGLMTARHET